MTKKYSGHLCFEAEAGLSKNSFIHIWDNEQHDDYCAHWHRELEFIMPVEQECVVAMERETYRLLPGDILVIPPGEVHALTAPQGGKQSIFLFDVSRFPALNGFSGIRSAMAKSLCISKDSCPNIYDDIYQILQQMRSEYLSGNVYSELVIGSLLMDFLVKFGRDGIDAGCLFPNVKRHKQEEYVRKFNKLQEYIESHYMEDINLEETARCAGFSKYHFSRLFKQYTGYTFYGYLCYRRIKAAEKLLAEPDISVMEVAIQSGFPSISTFNRLFKRQKRCTPSEYRAKKFSGDFK